MQRVGILGGTFDPVHEGHLAVADFVLHALSLARVILVPAARPWMKEGEVVASPKDRLQMLELAISGRPGLEVSTVDVERPGAAYSVDTVADLKSRLDPDTELFFIVGADAAAEMDRWRDPEHLLRECTVVAVGRPGCPLARQGGAARRVMHLDGPDVDVSATDVRARLASGRSADGLTPPAVLDYIREHGLYADANRPVPRSGTEAKA